MFFNTKNGDIRMVIENAHIKTGLGAGVDTSHESYDLGNVKKPNLGQVRSLLKKKGFDRGRLSYPFKVKWKLPKGKELSLGEIMKGIRAFWKKNESVVREGKNDDLIQSLRDLGEYFEG